MGNSFKNIKNYFKIHLVCIGAIIFLLIIVICGYFMFVAKEDNVRAEEIKTKTEEIKKDKKETKKKKIKVDVKGAVKEPGVYELESGSRVIDAINVAGGLTQNANTEIINLSKILEDQFVVVVYTDHDLKQVVMDKYVDNNYACPSTINDACIVDENNINTSKSPSTTTTASSTKAATSSKGNSKSTAKVNSIVNINTASLEELQTLSGIGESKAQAIIKYREENGGFKSVDELVNVPGIGASTLEKIKANITV